MTSAIGQILGTAVGVAISPVPVIALILMLFSRAAARNSISFTIGWVIGLSGVSAVVLLAGLGGSGGSGSANGVLKIVIGVVFLGLGLKQWRSRPTGGEEAEMPAWMASIDEVGPPKALGLGVILSAANPKNLGLTIAAAATIGSAGLTGGQEAITAGVYVLLASLTIILPTVGYLVAGERAAPALTSMKSWLIDNNATVMTVLFLVLGAKVLGDGISAIA